jgi:hypothetical protein
MTENCFDMRVSSARQRHVHQKRAVRNRRRIELDGNPTLAATFLVDRDARPQVL